MKGNIFIKRPVMAISISILILAIGLISLFTLPVEQYPDIAPPTVHVSATYTSIVAEPALVAVEVMYIMFSTPLMLSSSGMITLFITALASAPV